MMTVKAARQGGHQRLFCVSPTTSEYQYPGKKGFCEVLDSEYHALEKDKTGNKSQYIIFLDINEQTFLKDFADSSNKSLYHSYTDYIPALSLLFVKLTTEAHEQAHEALHDMFVRKFVLMNGLDLQLHMTGQVQKEHNGRKKKADQSYRPKTLPKDRSDYWYSLLIESAYSEKRSKLADDARWWLVESEGDVRTAVSIAVHQTTKEITIETWGLASRSTRQDKSKRVPEVTQRIVITQKTDDEEIRVRGDLLTIPFEHFFLRDGGTGEGDIVLDEADLKIVATSVWKVHPNL